MRGYGPSSYGDAMADVYDEWYGDGSSDTELGAMLARLGDLAGPGALLELGVGTGRVALALAARGHAVSGVDASGEMLRALAAKAGAEALELTVGDMARELPPGPFAVIYVVANTFFNLTSERDQRACLALVASRLTPDGSFVLEGFVPPAPDEPAEPTSSIEVRDIAVDRVVLSISKSDPNRQRAVGQFVDISETGIRLRPWEIRWASPAQLDEMAAAAGLSLNERWSDWAGRPFDVHAPRQVSVYRRAPRPNR